MAELVRSDTDHQQDIKYEQPEAPVDFGDQFATKQSLNVNISPKLGEPGMDFNMSGITTMDLSAEDLHLKGDNPAKSDGQSEQDGTLDKSDMEPPAKKPFLRSVPLDDVSCDSAKMSDSIVSMSSSVQGSTSSGKKSPTGDKSGQHFISYGRTYMIVNGKMVDDAAYVKRDREKEREERIKAQRDKLAEERQKKIEEMREQQRQAQEKRERQLDLRRLKIDELRRRDEERRMAVEDRRKRKDESELARKESIIQKSQDRITRYEQWKASGRKGYPGTSPPSKLLSMSTGALYHSSKSDFSSSGNLSVRGRPVESLLVLNSIPEAGSPKSSKSFLAPSGTPPSRPKSTMNLSTRDNVRLRDAKTLPRKPRPASIAGSVPSFITLESPKGASRSKSTDRLARDRQKTPSKSTPKQEKDEQNQQEKKDKRGSSVDMKRLTERRKAELQKLAEKKKEQKEQKDEQGSDHEKTPERSASRVSQKTIDRLSMPRVPKTPPADSFKEKATPPKDKVIPPKDKTTPPKDKVTPPRATPTQTKDRASTPTQMKGTKKSVTIVAPQSSPRKTRIPKQKDKENKEPIKKPPGNADVTESPRASPKPAVETKDSPAQEEKESAVAVEDNTTKEPTLTPTSPVSSKDGEKSADEENIAAAPKKTPEKVVKIVEPNEHVTPRPGGATGPATPASANKSRKEMEMDEYKAKLAEKRRQAREKAEREAELERQRLEEERLAEEERHRQEEEEQKRMEEEAARLAEQARKNEEERLRKAIEAEEQRRMEEAVRLEQERKLKEEADKRAKEEAERMEKEKQEKARREEEERLERKKRLEMIMKRVKSDSTMSTSMTGASSPMSGSVIGSMTGSMSGSLLIMGSDKADSPYQSLSNSPSKNSLQSNEGEDSGEESNGLYEKSDDRLRQLQSGQDTPKFKSPLLQKLVENKSQNGNETPKFKSPLLQNLMGKRLGMDKVDDKVATNGDKVDESEQSCEFISERVTEGDRSPVNMDNESDRSDSRNSRSDGSVDSDTSTAKDVSLAEQMLGSNSVIIKTEVSSSSLNGVSHNGQMEQYAQELVDSSISMRTADSSLATSSDQSLTGSLVDSQTAEPVSMATDTSSIQPSSEFEDFIDLSVTNKNFEVFGHQTTDDRLNLNTNRLDNNLDNLSSDAHPKPIIAFEDNAARRHEVTDFLS